MPNKKIMILGGGYYQLPLITSANKLGYDTIVCGIKGNYPGYQYATKWYDVDTFDRDACLKIAQDEEITGILTTGTDTMLPTLGYIVDELHLYGPSFISTQLSSDKLLMKKAFIQEGVRTATYQKIQTIEEAEKFAHENNYPVVLKVVDASGSRGIAIVHNDEELANQFYTVFQETKKDYIIIETFVKGQEFGAQAYVHNGILEMVMPHGDLTFHGKTDVPIGHYVPYEEELVVYEDLKEQLEKCIKALKIDNTAINADFILSDGKVYVLEIGARAGATCLPELVSNYFGTSYYDYMIRYAMRDSNVQLVPQQSGVWVETLKTDKTGVVTKILYPELPKEVLSFEIYPQIGDNVRTFSNAYDRIGTLVLKSDTLDKVKEIRDNFVSQIVIEVK